MIGGAALCLGAWLVAGVVGLPVDPFLPLAAGLALHGALPGWARVVAVAALGPMTAAACGDVVVERTVLYAALAVVATRAEWTLRDGVVARTVLVAGTLATVLGVRAALAALGDVAGPGQSLPGVVATVAWTALHAALGRAAERVGRT